MYSKAARIDYKSCFDSIYSHSYKWIIAKDTIESKGLSKGSDIYSVIDRVLQNINGKSSNGIIVGPEFSRMIAEILLQTIDKEIYFSLLELGKKQNRDYVINRYVDDIFIFANDDNVINAIIEMYQLTAAKYRLAINELKVEKMQTPIIMGEWLADTRAYANYICDMFYSTQEERQLKGFLLKEGYLSTDKYKDGIKSLIKRYDNYIRYIVSFILSTILKKVSSKKAAVNIFQSEVSAGKIFTFLELVLYIYSFCPCFEHTQRLLSIFNYVFDEMDMQADENIVRLKALISKYSFIFINNDLHDIVNLFLLLIQYNIPLNSKTEDKIIEKAVKADDPIIWGNVILYARYHQDLFSHVKDIIENTINQKIVSMTSDNEMLLYSEFWYLLIFYNCPFIANSVKQKIKQKLEKLDNSGCEPIHRVKKLLYDFMQGSSGFFYWQTKGLQALKQITYRTHERTMFRNFKTNSSALLGSLD